MEYAEAEQGMTPRGRSLRPRTREGRVAPSPRRAVDLAAGGTPTRSGRPTRKRSPSPPPSSEGGHRLLDPGSASKRGRLTRRDSASTSPSARQLLAPASGIFLREAALVVALVFGGCCTNVYTLERIVRQAPGSGNLITFAQFLIVALEGLWSNVRWTPLPRLLARRVPLHEWARVVGLFWCVSIVNNLALGYKISMPLHIIFRSSSILVSLLLSVFWLRRPVSAGKGLGVLVVTAGVILTTLSSAPRPHTASGDAAVDAAAAADVTTWYQGLGLLILAVLLSCLLGQYQQHVYETYGKHWREGMFYIHALGLLPFALLLPSLRAQVREYNASELVSPWPAIQDAWLLQGEALPQYAAPWTDVLRLVALARIPALWRDLVLNMFTQFFCIAGVQKLSSMTTSVTLNLVLGIRKFLSLLLSVMLFSNDFTAMHMLGTCIVVAGTILYGMS